MSDDPYTVLGVPRDASHADIKKAYRTLAKALHPDLAPGDAAKAARFQRVGAAWDILGDPERRRRFDAGEIDAAGQERAARRPYADAGARHAASAGYGDFGAFADLFGARRGGGFGARASGADLRYRLEVDFMDAALGARRAIPLPGGATIDLAIPAGLRDGQTLRLRGKGQPGPGGGPAGDAYVECTVRPHPRFRRDGLDTEVEVPVGFDEAVLGARIEVPTIHGPVSMTVPKGSSSGRRLRLRGKGIAPAGAAPGDHFVRLRITIPERVDTEMERIAREWRDRVRFAPRGEG